VASEILALVAFSRTWSAICPYASKAAKSLPSALARSLLAAILFLALRATHGAEWVVEGQVVGISDGDTITVLDNSYTKHKIRFAGIDAPEKGQAFGERSKHSLSALVFQKRVEARCHKKDHYGREVCAVFVSLRDVGLEQIRLGMAWHYKEYQHEQPTQERLVYAQEEESARASRVGLWKDAKPVAPWEWRKR
jgi:endonuclease YncB( thermonuclease family)